MSFVLDILGFRFLWKLLWSTAVQQIRPVMTEEFYPCALQYDSTSEELGLFILTNLSANLSPMFLANCSIPQCSARVLDSWVWLSGERPSLVIEMGKGLEVDALKWMRASRPEMESEVSRTVWWRTGALLAGKG